MATPAPSVSAHASGVGAGASTTTPPPWGPFTLPAILLQSTAPSSSPPPQLISQGAEGRLYKTTYLYSGLPCALKYRPPKPYRHPLLDARLTKHRVLAEARNLVRCRRELLADGGSSGSNDGKGGKAAVVAASPVEGAAVSVPALYALDEAAGWLMMEWVEGEPVRKQIHAYLEAKKAKESSGGVEFAGSPQEEVERVVQEVEPDEELAGLMRRIGEAIGRMHRIGIIHGDLTTSNMMLRPLPTSSTGGSDGNAPSILSGEIVLIDFGLSSQSLTEEDRAVDLYVLERAFGSTHPRAESFFPILLEAYEPTFKGTKGVLRKLEDVRMRGRKRTMVG